MSYEGRFEGRSAIVTGGASGIGLAIASRLAEEGAKVSLWDLKPDALASAQSDAGAVHGIALDVSDPAQVSQAMASSVDALGGHLDILVRALALRAPTSRLGTTPSATGSG